jgi:hypothetical protein
MNVCSNVNSTSTAVSAQIEKPTLAQKLQESCRTRNPKLDISHIHMDILPAQLLEFEWVHSLKARQCGLKGLVHLPPNLKHLDASLNNISVADELTLHTLDTIDLSTNKLREIGGTEFCPMASKIDVGSNNISAVHELPSSLRIFDISHNRIKSIPDTNQDLEILCISGNPIQHLSKLPSRMKEFYCDGCRFEVLYGFPNTLEILHASDNQIYNIHGLPASLKELKASKNFLDAIDWSQCTNLLTIDISGNIFKTLPNDVPSSLKSIDISGNKYLEIPQQMKDMNNNDQLDTFYYDSDSDSLTNVTRTSSSENETMLDRDEFIDKYRNADNQNTDSPPIGYGTFYDKSVDSDNESDSEYFNDHVNVSALKKRHRVLPLTVLTNDIDDDAISPGEGSSSTCASPSSTTTQNSLITSPIGLARLKHARETLYNQSKLTIQKVEDIENAVASPPPGFQRPSTPFPQSCLKKPILQLDKDKDGKFIPFSGKGHSMLQKPKDHNSSATSSNNTSDSTSAPPASATTAAVSASYTGPKTSYLNPNLIIPVKSIIV